MINYPEGLTESQISLYIAAFKKCRELIKEKNNQVTVDEIVEEVIEKWGPIVDDQDKLRIFLMTEVKIPVEPVHIMVDKSVKDSKWFYTYRKEKGHLMEYWRRYYDYL